MSRGWGRACGAALVAAACGAEQPPASRLRATVIRTVSDTSRDTVRFDAAVLAWRCAGDAPAGVVLAGTQGGNGVLLWLRPGDSGLIGTYGPLPRGDTTAHRGAIVAARFMMGDVARGATLDSGVVTVTERAGRLGAAVRGGGLALPGATHVALDAEFERVPPPVDTGSCAVQLPAAPVSDTARASSPSRLH